MSMICDYAEKREKFVRASNAFVINKNHSHDHSVCDHPIFHNMDCLNLSKWNLPIYGEGERERERKRPISINFIQRTFDTWNTSFNNFFCRFWQKIYFYCCACDWWKICCLLLSLFFFSFSLSIINCNFFLCWRQILSLQYFATWVLFSTLLVLFQYISSILMRVCDILWIVKFFCAKKKYIFSF